MTSSMPISGTLKQFLPTMSRLRIIYAWFIYFQFEHGCDLDFRQITLDFFIEHVVLLWWTFVLSAKL